MSRRFRVVAAAAVLALVGGVASGCPSSPSKPPRTTAATVTTSTGVVTHGSIATTENTIGWLLTCPLSHRLPDDPIVVPGVRGGAHLHDFTGNASADATSTYATMTDLSNAAVADQFNGPAVKPGTSCDMATYAPGTAADTAAYWRPVLYANGQPVTSTVKDQLYYRAKPTFGTGFQAIPADARLIVGSHSATSVAGNQALAEGNLYWECNGITDVHYPTPPNDCKGGSILENVVFPSCWDGQPMDHTGPGRTDNGHFAYAVDGTCPAAFGVKVPQLSEKFKYDNIPAGALLQLSADPGGVLLPTWTAHADFWNTWRQAALVYLTERCINAQISCGTNPVAPTGN
jgi:hypothetical protein